MNQFSIAFPKGAVVCAAGNYLICHPSPERWQVYRVEDILLVKRLVPLLDDPSILLIEEHMLDSMSPAYFNEAQLLLTAVDPDFTSEAEALQAIHLQKLTERAKGLLRPAREFTKPDCRVVRQANTPLIT
jgi:hypothetical protein